MASPISRWCAVGLASAAASGIAAAHTLPPGFFLEEAVDGLQEPVAIAFAGDGRIFVAEQWGVVRVIENGQVREEPFLDLRDEVDDTNFRGMLGIALPPNFADSRHVYVSYAVVSPADPSGGTYDPTFGRITRYTGTSASGGNIADPKSRAVIIGEEPHEGFVLCWAHIVNTMHFASDGSLMVSVGDGAFTSGIFDGGGHQPGCFQEPLFDPIEDIGSFRAQFLGSMSGKILRLDPSTGDGLPDNPYWNGDADSAESRIWASGLRNPFRFCIRPGTGTFEFPGVLYIGDVGRKEFEEVNVSRTGGENFGWPCFEGPAAAPGYPNLDPPHSGCDTLETPDNPGPLTPPLVAVHQNDPGKSHPAAVTGATIIGGDFYTGDSYPLVYRDGYFFGDWVAQWLRVVRVDEADEIVNSFTFAEELPGIVQIAADPVSGDLHLISRVTGMIYRLCYDGPGVGDLTADGSVGVADLLLLLESWGDCGGGPLVCPADLDGDGAVGVADLLALLAHWGPS